MPGSAVNAARRSRLRVEMDAALALGQCVDFIDDRPAHRAQQRQPCGLAEEDAEALGRCEKDVRRAGLLPGADGAGGIARAHADADRRGIERCRRFREGLLEIFLEIVGERAQRRDVEALDRIGERMRAGSERNRARRGMPPASCRCPWARR